MPALIVGDHARDDIVLIASTIAQDNLRAALRFYDAAENGSTFLSENPGAGPKIDPPITSHADLRFWPLTGFRNHLVIYKPFDDGVKIVHVLHGARDIARLLRGA